MKDNKKIEKLKRHRTAAGSGSQLQKGPSRLRALVLPAIVFFWPFVYLFRHIIPINGTYTAIGNDFIALYFRHKIYLLSCLADFRLPLWSPSEAAGFPLYTNPFAQVFYPFNLLLVVWYKLFNGYNVLDQQLFTVFGIAIFALGLFLWLRILSRNTRAVLFATLVMSVSFKMTEILRFPNAVHSAAWYPWILYATTKILLGSSWKKSSLYGILLAFSFICLLTAGYPYYIYYTIFLIGPYLLVFLIKPLKVQLIGPEVIRWRRALTVMALAGIAAIVICSPYLLGFIQLMPQATDRSGTDFAYSTQHTFTFEDTIGSLMYPPAAMEDGWNFFSITGLLIVLLYLVCGSADGTSRLLTRIFFVVWIAVISYISYGKDSYLFIFLWKYMPGFSILRVWPRINIILVPILAWLLTLSYASLESLIAGGADEKRTKKRASLAALILIYAVIVGTQLYLYLNKIYDPYWLEYFNQLTPLRAKFIIYGIAGFVCLLIFLTLSLRIRLETRRALVTMFIVLLSAAVFEMRPVGTHLWTHEGDYQPGRFTLDVPAFNRDSFRFPRITKSFTIALGPVFSAGIIENWYFTRYIRFLNEHNNEPESLRVILGAADTRRIFFSESIGHSTIKSFLEDADRFRNTGKLISYTGDELEWEINAPVDGYFNFIDNWDYGWEVYVDGRREKMELLFATFKSVRISAGHHRVEFHYRPGFCLFSKKTPFNPGQY
ncbi:MAG: hypothetical protein JW749_05890 [Sedimentisphaerales bacterium]|nr:hypothetical protein [Sedimentisphaerales bacterium]